MKINQNELTLQKCVDGELSPAERVALLNRLDASGSLDQWRTLALSFVENQVLAKAFQEELTPPTALPLTGAKKTSVWRRQVRPWASAAASLLVGALVGVGGHFYLRESPSPNSNFATSPMENSLIGNPILADAETLSPPVEPISPHIAGTRYVPVMNVNMGGKSSSSGRGISVPVYCQDHLKTLPANGSMTNMSEEVQKILEEEGYQLDRELHWYRVKMHDGREALVPGEYVRVRSPATSSTP